MEIQLTPDQNSLVHLAIEQGRFSRAEDAVKDALALWEERERARIDLLAEVEAAANSPDGDDTVLDSEEDIASFIESVKQRGRTGLSKF